MAPGSARCIGDASLRDTRPGPGLARVIFSSEQDASPASFMVRCSDQPGSVMLLSSHKTLTAQCHSNAFLLHNSITCHYPVLIHRDRDMHPDFLYNDRSRVCAGCSSRGYCGPNGTCVCDAGWVGETCDRLGCPDDCSRHGVCQVSVHARLIALLQGYRY